MNSFLCQPLFISVSILPFCFQFDVHVHMCGCFACIPMHIVALPYNGFVACVYFGQVDHSLWMIAVCSLHVIFLCSLCVIIVLFFVHGFVHDQWQQSMMNLCDLWCWWWQLMVMVINGKWQCWLMAMVIAGNNDEWSQFYNQLINCWIIWIIELCVVCVDLCVCVCISSCLSVPTFVVYGRLPPSWIHDGYVFNLMQYTNFN